MFLCRYMAQALDIHRGAGLIQMDSDRTKRIISLSQILYHTLEIKILPKEDKGVLKKEILLPVSARTAPVCVENARNTASNPALFALTAQFYLENPSIFILQIRPSE